MVGANIGDLEVATELLDHIGYAFNKAAGKVQPLEIFLVAADEPRRVPGREPHPLLLVEHRVGNRCQVLQPRHQRWGQSRTFDRQSRHQLGTDYRRRCSPACVGEVGERGGGAGVDRSE